MSKNKLTPSNAAKYIQEQHGFHITAASLSAWIRTGRCPFGEYIRRKGCNRGMFLIFPDRIDAYFRPRNDIGRLSQDGIYF